MPTPGDARMIGVRGIEALHLVANAFDHRAGVLRAQPDVGVVGVVVLFARRVVMVADQIGRAHV